MDLQQEDVNIVSEKVEENNDGSGGEDGNARDQSAVDEEEDECRVCRGSAENGRPLVAPCKCSGSIGLTHQDCLMSWLEVTRGDGRCELCKTKFQFDPQYAENAPEHLPPYEVLLGLSSRFLAKWLPFTIRILLAASLWLLVAPYLTSCLYHGWMHRPSSIVSRWKREIIPSDIVSGAIIAGIVIISFLSLMSFADFLRVHWQQPLRRGEEAQQQPREDDFANGFRDDGAFANNGVDNSIIKHMEQRKARKRASEDGQSKPLYSERLIRGAQAELDDELAMLRETRLRNGEDFGDFNPTADRYGRAQQPDNGDEDYDDDESDSDGDDDDLPPPLINRFDVLHADDDDSTVEGGDGLDEDERLDPVDRPFDPMDPLLQDDQVDMEINVALDELLGLRGPPSTLIRNLLWLLAFNATYLGIFSFVPKTVGSAVYSGILNTTICESFLKRVPYVYSEDSNAVTVLSTVASLNNETATRNPTFRATDVSLVTLGYFSVAAMIVLMRYGFVFSQRFGRPWNAEGIDAEHARRTQRQREEGRADHAFDGGGAEDPAAASTALGVALDAAVAVVKVGVLLFMKMFLLPLVLGLSLDASTLQLFGKGLSDRIAFAGEDLFSFTLLHWVSGITFMLLVTVFLLQLREVIHPDLLARLIRPQEPQPDLLGNLMNESVGTHVKRMLLSLAIYAPLLVLHVTLPIKLFFASRLGGRFTFFHLNFWHVLMPQLQIPLELIIFHLSMLALLERYKNSIGGMQHSWMVFMGRKMGITENILPFSVAKFELAGKKNLFLSSSDPAVDPFWYDLLQKEVDVDPFIESNITNRPAGDVATDFLEGEVKVNGERVLSKSLDYIRLPQRPYPPPEFGSSAKDSLLPVSIGSFRLRCSETEDSVAIEFWREVRGSKIPRPPDGWDDLGVGGAFVQGRWAWGKEIKSVVERSVAQRLAFKNSATQKTPMSLILKVGLLVLLSWLAIATMVFFVITTPLAVGRSVYSLFRVPTCYVHDPLAFVIGASLFFPMASLIFKTFDLENLNLKRQLGNWIRRCRFPPRQKLASFMESTLLWFVIAPLSLGIVYEVTAVKATSWFAGEESFFDPRVMFVCWLVGLTVLQSWALLCYLSVFTGSFWNRIGNGILEPPPDENIRPAGMQNNGGARHQDGEEVDDEMVDNAGHSWQGQDGRVAKFFTVYGGVLLRWEWENVDKTKLLEEFARPVAKELASALLGSSIIFQFATFLLPVLFPTEAGGLVLPLVGVVNRGLLWQMLFRMCMASHVLVQLASAFRSRLESWFHAAHEAARDDRYLIGEVLRDYKPEEVS